MTDFITKDVLYHKYKALCTQLELPAVLYSEFTRTHYEDIQTLNWIAIYKDWDFQALRKERDKVRKRLERIRSRTKDDWGYYDSYREWYDVSSQLFYLTNYVELLTILHDAHKVEEAVQESYLHKLHDIHLRIITGSCTVVRDNIKYNLLNLCETIKGAILIYKYGTSLEKEDTIEEVPISLPDSVDNWCQIPF